MFPRILLPSILTASLLVAGGGGLATAQTETAEPTPEAVITDLNSGETVVVFDPALSEKFKIEREVVDEVAAKFGKAAVFSSGKNLPEGLDASIVPGNTLPESADVKDVPESLRDLPTSAPGTHWVAIGEHLVEVTPDNEIVMVVYDALP